VNDTATGLPALPMNNQFASLPQRLSVTATTPQQTVTLTQFAKPINVVLRMDDTHGPGGVNRSALFFIPPHAGTWSDAAAMQTSTIGPATFAAVTREIPRSTVAVTHPSQSAMQRVTARLTFSDMFEYSPNLPVNTTAFNNIMNALANNHNRVNLNATLPANDLQSLQRARMLAPTPLMWESAVDILVRFYELRTRRIVSPLTTPQMVVGLNNATPALQQNILKAADIGFFNGGVNPQGALTMGDLMQMLDIIFNDTGY